MDEPVVDEVIVTRDEVASLSPTSCCFCGRPLTDASSRQFGWGPTCAEKYGLPHGQLGDEPPASDETIEAVEKEIAGLPQSVVRSIRRGIEDGSCRAIVNKAIYQASVAVSHPDNDRTRVLSAVYNIANRCGYSKVAEALSDQFLNQSLQVVAVKLKRGAGGQIDVFSPYNPTLLEQLRTVPGRRWDGARKCNTVPEASLFKLMQALSAVYPNEAMVDVDGNLVTIPAVIELPPPPTKPAPGPKPGAGTGELDWGVNPANLAVGMTVLDPQGRERIVGWVSQNPKNPSAGLRIPGQKNYEFISFAKLRYLPKKEVQAVQDAQQMAQEQGAKDYGAPPPPPPPVITRSVPEGTKDYQVVGIQWLDKVKSGILGDEPGLGKTMQACVASDPRVVVVCPAAMRVEWGREMNRWRPELRVLVVGGTKPYAKSDYEAADVIVINYDILAAHAEVLGTIEVKTVICDEAQYLKNLKQKGRDRELEGSRRALAVFDLIAQTGAEKRFMLTATPIMNRVIELWSLLYLVDPIRWDSYSKFGMRYCNGQLVDRVVKGGRRVRMYDFSGSSNTRELHTLLGERYMLRRNKGVLNLPEKSRQTLLVPLEDAAAKEYRRAVKDFLKWVEETGGSKAAASAKKAEAIVRLTTLRHFVAVAKIEAAMEWIVNHAEGTGRPLCVFAHHQDVTQTIASRLREMQFDSPRGERRTFRVGTILGGQAEADRTRAKDAFQAGELDVIVLSIQAAGVGLTLTAATESLFVERAWRPADLVQAEDRIWRLGTKNACTITYIDAKNTIDEVISKMLVDKAETFYAVVDGQDISEDGAQTFVLDAIFGELEDMVKNPQGELPGIDWWSGGHY